MSVTDQAYPDRTDMSAVVQAARHGDQRAMDQLVSYHLPLVYNIVGRALNRSADVDDVVQDTMLSVVRGLTGVRDPRLFRSWLVAVTMNEIRDHQQRRHTAPAPPEDIDNLIDPGSDFEDLTLTQLRLSDQRREVALATRWLDDDHRHLLSLWWLAEAGHLSRTDLVNALQLDAHHVTVRVARMKAQLDTARLVVRALAARPGCAGLLGTAADWHGRPASLWRKRLARHIRTCPYCPNTTSDLVPAERLLAGLALTLPPAGLAAQTTGQVHTLTGAAHTVAPAGARAGAHAKTAGLLQQVRVGAISVPKLLVGAVAAVAVVGGGGMVLAGHPAGPDTRTVSGAGPRPAAVIAEAEAAEPTPRSPSPAAPRSSPAAPRPGSAAPSSPAPVRSTSRPPAKATSKPAAEPAGKPAAEPTSKPAAEPAGEPAGEATQVSTDVSAAEQRLLVLLNERRSALGLPPVELGETQRREAEACVRMNLDKGGMTHCGHEVLFASSGNSSPEQMIEAWFDSPGHKTALTYAGSRFAGPAIVWNGSRQVSAINIDY